MSRLVDPEVWTELREARAAAAAADAAWKAARLAWWTAPRALRRERHKAQLAAQAEAIRAALTLSRLQKQAGTR